MINTETATAVAGGLTAEGAAALRRADSVTFHTRQGRAFIRARKQAAPGREVFTAREQRLYPEPDGAERIREIAVDFGLTSYGTDRDRPGTLPGADWTAFHMIHTAQYAPAWRTIAALLRKGDALRLGWLADGGNQYVKDAGLHDDQLQLHVTRGEQDMVFHVGHSVTPDNSARMIRREG